ncbi:MAG: hypothetical protein IAF08_14290, partial [Rhizobacter sp.]|nr:hypothetical protein [Chlorobiales bacterium]
MNLIFIFLDGVGLAPASAHNPLTTAMPRLASVLGGTLTLETAPIIKESLLLTAIDAGLQTEGAGQSGTGQFSIYTSLNGAKLFGRHYGPYLPWALKPALAGANVFRKLQEHGRTACYANAYPKRFIDTCLHLRTVGKTRGSVLFEAAAMENIPLRGAAEVKAGTAISGDIISKWWGTNREDGDAGVSSITPEQAAENLLHLSAMHGAVFYEFFLTDLAAHRRITASVDEVLT